MLFVGGGRCRGAVALEIEVRNTWELGVAKPRAPGARASLCACDLGGFGPKCGHGESRISLLGWGDFTRLTLAG